MSLNPSVRVRAAMSKEMVTAEAEHSIRDAIRKMVKKEVGAVVVTDKGTPVGMVTERDILRSIGYKRADTDGQVGSIMSKPLISIDSTATLGEAAELMIKHKIRRLMVKEGDKYVGIITQRDLQRLMTDTFKSLLLY